MFMNIRICLYSCINKQSNHPPSILIEEAPANQITTNKNSINIWSSAVVAAAAAVLIVIAIVVSHHHNAR